MESIVQRVARILFIDDDPGGREMAVYMLRKAGHAVDEASSAKEGLALFHPDRHDLVITDVRMPEMSGLDLTRALRTRAPDVPVLVITAYGSIETAVEAMKAGAHDFVVKPFSRDQLLIVVDKAAALRALSRENRELKRKLKGVERPMVFRSAAMASLIQMIDRVAQSDASVLITGESGTGKELVARRIHAQSARGEGPFVVVNCAAIPHDLLEAELFGHEKGAFTGATLARAGRFRKAHAGTLFLDEVAELPLALQVKLLRVLQEKVIDVVGSDQPVSVDVRVVAATNRDLRAEVSAGRFREELYFRLNVVELHVPPLRQRPDDIPELVRHFLRELAPDRELGVAEALIDALKGQSWPGNVRELRNACERMVVLSPGDELSLQALPGEPPAGAARVDRGLTLPPDGLSLVDLERTVIERALHLKEGNIAETARYLRVPRHILVYRIEKYGITRPAKK